MKRQTLVAVVLVTILLASLVGFAVAQGPDRRGGHKLPVAPETPANDESAEIAVAEAADAETADAWEPDLGVVEGPGLRAGPPDRRAGAYSFVGGGRKNKADGAYSSVVGGYNSWAKSKYATIGGGQHNTAKGWRSTIAGGRDNETKAEYATVGGGRENKATQGYSTVGGGYSNIAGGGYATVGGGYGNTASGFEATVGGGLSNTASGSRTTVGGGDNNTASGSRATVPGGYHNTASGHYSFAAGYRAKATHTGSFVWSDSTDADFASQREDQFRVRANGGARFDVNDSQWVDIRSSGGKVIDTSTGAYLSSGGNWTNSSDRALKENFSAVESQDVLRKLADMPISTWDYRAKEADPAKAKELGLDSNWAEVRHMGPTSQDFYAAFGLGDDDRHISTLDADGVALAAIQGLYHLVQELQAENAALREEVSQLRALEARLTAIEERLE